MYLLQAGDTFITNAIAYDTTSYANKAAVDAALVLLATTDVYGIPTINGRITLAKAAQLASAKTQLRAIAVTTLPNGDWAVEFEVQKNNKV